MTRTHPFNVTSPDLRRAVAALDAAKLPARMSKPLTAGMRQAVRVYRNSVRKEASGHRVTGKMRDRIRTKFWGRGTSFRAGVKSTGVGTNLVVNPVREHQITAGGKAMPMWGGRGSWKKGAGRGITGFAQSVQHPGYRGDPFFARGIDAVQPEIDMIIQGIADQIAHDIAAAINGRGR